MWASELILDTEFEMPTQLLCEVTLTGRWTFQSKVPFEEFLEVVYESHKYMWYSRVFKTVQLTAIL